MKVTIVHVQNALIIKTKKSGTYTRRKKRLYRRKIELSLKGVFSFKHLGTAKKFNGHVFFTHKNYKLYQKRPRVSKLALMV